MCSFRPQSDEIPKHIGIFQVGCWIPFLSVNKTGEKYGIPDEKNGSVVTDQIPVSLFSVEFEGEATRVTGGIG